MWTCSTCGEVHEESFSSCWKCEGSPAGERGNATAAQGTGTIRLAASQGTLAVTNFGPASKARYAEAYASARTFIFTGKVVKGIGVLIFLLGLVSLMGSGNEYGGADPAAEMFAGVAAMMGGVVFMMGLFMAAQAQLQMSCLDSAVHTSPFLNDVQRAETMRLRLG